MKASLFISGLVFTIANFGLHVVCSEEEEGRSKKFDFFVFSQIWPITSCDIWEARESSNTCFLPQESKFYCTISVILTFQELWAEIIMFQ